MDLNKTAHLIVAELRAHDFEDDGGIRQALALAEEAGEMVGAYRRWTGRARRTGTEEEFRSELADVVITAYVTAAEQRATLNVMAVPFTYREPMPETAWPSVLAVFAAVNVFVSRWQVFDQATRSEPLEEIVRCCRHLAQVLDIDLDADITAKLDVIFKRGWRELCIQARKTGVVLP